MAAIRRNSETPAWICHGCACRSFSLSMQPRPRWPLNGYTRARIPDRAGLCPDGSTALRSDRLRHAGVGTRPGLTVASGGRVLHRGPPGKGAGMASLADLRILAEGLDHHEGIA